MMSVMLTRLCTPHEMIDAIVSSKLVRASADHCSSNALQRAADQTGHGWVTPEKLLKANARANFPLPLPLRPTGVLSTKAQTPSQIISHMIDFSRLAQRRA